MRPDVAGTPTTFSRGALIADLVATNDIDQTVELDASLTSVWKDRRLAGVVGCRFPYEALWTRQLQRDDDARAEGLQPPQLIVAENSVVTSTVTYSGWIFDPFHMAES
jgi:hypothetical protein